MANRAPPTNIRWLSISLAGALLLVFAVPPANAGSLVNVSASAPSQVNDAVEQWTFHFQTAGAIPAGGDIRIVFPAGFTTNATTTCDVFNPTMSGENATVVSATEVVCELGTNSVVGGTTVTVGFTQMQNPTSTGTYSIQIETRGTQDAVIDTGSASVQIREPAGPLSNLQVSAPDQHTGATTSWAFSFTTNTTVPGDGKLRVDFPVGFQTHSGSDTACNIQNPTLQNSGTFVVDQRSIVCWIGNTDSIPNGTNVQLTISSMRNPTVEQRTAPFVIKTMTSSEAILDSDSANQEDILAHDFVGKPEASVPNNGVGQVNTMSFTFVPFNAWAADGKLRISFPPGFTFDTAGPGTTVASFVGGGSGTFGAPTKSGQDLTFARSGGAIIYGGTEVRVNVTHIRNPTEPYDQTGPFTLTTSNKDGGTHDVEAADGIPVGTTATTTPATTTTPTTTPATNTTTNAAASTNATANSTNTTGNQGNNQFTGTEPPGSIFGDDEANPEDTPAPALAFALLGALVPLARRRRRRPSQ